MIAPVASILIATYNKAPALARTLASIRRQIDLPVEVIVVDDGSTDATADVAFAWGVTYSPLAPSGYRNPAPVRNLAVQLSTAPILILQSDEVEHVGAVIAPLVRIVERGHPVLATVTNVNADGDVLDVYCSPRKRRPLFFLGAILREDFLAVGGFDESFVDPGYEDQWFGDCLAHTGRPCHFTDAVQGRHWDHPRPANSKSVRSKRIYQQHVAYAETQPEGWRAWRSPFVQTYVG